MAIPLSEAPKYSKARELADFDITEERRVPRMTREEYIEKYSLEAAERIQQINPSSDRETFVPPGFRERRRVKDDSTDLRLTFDYDTNKYFFRELDRSWSHEKAQSFVDHLLLTDLSAAGLEEIINLGVTSVEKQMNETEEWDERVVDVSYLEREHLNKIRGKVRERMRSALHEIRNTSERLLEVKESQGEIEMLRQLAVFAYKETKYQETKNDLVSVFAPNEGEGRQANCDGRARALSVLLTELGYSDEQISWECFADHVRVVVKSRDLGALLIEGGVKAWQPTPGRPEFSLQKIEQYLVNGEPLVAVDQREQPAPGGSQNDSDVFNLFFNPNRHVQKKSKRTSPVQFAPAAFGATELFGDGDVRENEDRNAEIVVELDPKKVAQDDEERKKKQEQVHEKQTLEQKILSGEVSVSEAQAVSVREALKQPLAARLSGLKEEEVKAVLTPDGKRNVKRELAFAGALFGGFTLAGVGVGFAESFVHDAVEVASELYNKPPEPGAPEPKGKKPAGGSPAAAPKPDMEIFAASFSPELEKYWSTTFSDIEYICRLSPDEKEWPLMNGKTAHSASFQQTREGQNIHDLVVVTPTVEEKGVTGHFWELMVREMSEEAAGGSVERVVEFHSASKKYPLKSKKLLKEFSEAMPESVEKGLHQLTVKIDGKVVVSSSW